MLEYIYVCRHGFRSNWVDPSIKTGPTGMPRDPPLAAYGLDQAQALSHFLSSATALAPYPVPERVFSSPFYRCIQTAIPTSIALKSGGKVVDAKLGVAGLSKTDEELGISATGAGIAGGAAGTGSADGGGSGVMLEHGVSEWYSNVKPNTGLHPRPASPSKLSTLFPGQIDLSYSSTVYPSRRGESLKELHDRADLWVEAWTTRAEEMGFKCVVVFAHAASVIAIGRAGTGGATGYCASIFGRRIYEKSLARGCRSSKQLTGDKDLEVVAGCASTSLYRRKPPPNTTDPNAQASTRNSIVPSRSSASLNAVSGLLALSTGRGSTDDRGSTANENGPIADGEGSGIASGIGEWEPVFLGRADYLVNGVERDWSFRDAVYVNGEVVLDDGDGLPHPPEDTIPNGLAPGMERYLRRGRPEKNVRLKELEQGVMVGKGKM